MTPITARKVQFTKAEANQLLAYLQTARREGWYYGNHRQFLIREASILKKLNLILNPDLTKNNKA